MIQSLSSYKIFYTVAKTKNISKAAKELYISQPAISKSIQKLEDNLNCKLFYRSSRGVNLTTEGELLFQHVNDAFDTLNRGEENLKHSLDLGIGHLRLGVSTTLCKHLLLPYLREFTTLYPHINISIFCQSSNETLKLIEENKLDVGLVAEPENTKNLDYFFIKEIEDIFVASPSYIQKIPAALQDVKEILSNSTLMLLDKHNMTRQFIDEYLLSQHISSKDILEVSNMDLLIDFAKTNLGIACVIKEFILNELENNELLELHMDTPIHKRNIGFVHKTSLQSSIALKNFVNYYKTKK